MTAESGEYVGKSLGKTREKPTAVEKNLQNVQERAILYIRLTEQKNQNRIFKTDSVRCLRARYDARR